MKKSFPPQTAILGLLLLVVSVAGSPAEETEDGAKPLTDPDKFETRQYPLPGSSIRSSPPSFDEPPPQRPPTRLSAREVFEEYGIVFPEGATAKYNPATHSVTIRHTRRGFLAIEKILSTLVKSADKQLNLRIEIYELPRDKTRELQEAKAANPDHRDQLDEVRALTGKGIAQGVTSTEVTARSGQRSKAESIRQVRAVTGYEWDEKAEAMLPQFEDLETGVIFEVDPVLGPDDEIDVNLSLRLLTEDPNPRLATVQFPNEDAPREIAFPLIHEGRVTTQITTKAGFAVLIGVFESQPIDGKDANPDAMWVAFLMPEIQFLDVKSLKYELIAEDSDKTEAP